MGVDQGCIETCLCAVVEKDRVQDLATRHGQAEADIGDSQDALGQWQLGLEPANALDRASRRADVVFIPCTAGKDQGVEPNVFRRKAHLLGEDSIATTSYLCLTLDAHRHAGFIDHTDDQGGPVPLSQGHHPLETRATLFQVDGIEHRFALTPCQSPLHDLRIGGVDHQRELDHTGDLLEEVLDVGHFVTIGGSCMQMSST